MACWWSNQLGCPGGKQSQGGDARDWGCLPGVVYYTFLSWALKVLVYSDEDAINKNVMVTETIGKL